MGWFFTTGATRDDVVKELLDHAKDRSGCDGLLAAALAYENRQWVLWTVEEFWSIERGFARLICCYLLEPNNSRGDRGWGYKPMDETVRPSYYSVPRRWLEQWPVVVPDGCEAAEESCDEWRSRCRWTPDTVRKTILFPEVPEAVTCPS